ncbi:MAG: membrane protein insertion efficiency factor YidD [Candidatus Acidiferrales bacterium]|jgi:putative membrane protein insertion efficiency factor
MNGASNVASSVGTSATSGATAATRARSAGAWVLLALIRMYQIFLSPFLGGTCKYHPSCSRYAQEAVQKHGARRGAWLALKRLGRCRPFVKGGFDPVPEPEDL